MPPRCGRQVRAVSFAKGKGTAVRSRNDIEEAMDRHADTVWRVCMLHFSERQDAQDAFQNAFLNYALADGARFADEEHRKAWLIRTASNACKDIIRSSTRRIAHQEDVEKLDRVASADSLDQPGSAYREAVEALRSLDDPPRTPLYLAVCEGYTAPEIADMLDAPVNTVYTWISRGKATLRRLLR